MKANMLMADNPVKVMTLAIIGAEKTKSWVVLRELNFKRGDIIELEDVEARLEKSRQNIYNLGLFNDVQMKAQVIGDQLHVIIEVKERWFVFGAPILRLEERNSYDIVNTIRERNFRRLVYGMNVSWRNITGRNETLTFSGQLGFSKRLRVNFLRPAMFRKSNVDLRMGYRFINEKEIIVGTEEGQVQWRGTESEPFQVSHEPFIAFQKRISLYENLYFEFNYKWLSFSDSLYVLEIDPSRNNFITELDGKEAYPSFILQYSVDR
ncbi:MAG: POTRA domain-containing protein, partial [Bacteroidota bacterium]